MAAERSQRPRTCGVLLDFAREQLRTFHHTVANVSRILEQQRRQSAGLIVCLHEGHVLYQPADGRTRHVMHGDCDRAWQTLNVLFQMARATPYNARSVRYPYSATPAGFSASALEAAVVCSNSRAS